MGAQAGALGGYRTPCPTPGSHKGGDMELQGVHFLPADLSGGQLMGALMERALLPGPVGSGPGPLISPHQGLQAGVWLV